MQERSLLSCTDHYAQCNLGSWFKSQEQTFVFFWNSQTYLYKVYCVFSSTVNFLGLIHFPQVTSLSDYTHTNIHPSRQHCVLPSARTHWCGDLPLSGAGAQQRDIHVNETALPAQQSAPRLLPGPWAPCGGGYGGGGSGPTSPSCPLLQGFCGQGFSVLGPLSLTSMRWP